MRSSTSRSRSTRPPRARCGALEYNTDLFDASTIERMAGHYADAARGRRGRRPRRRRVSRSCRCSARRSAISCSSSGTTRRRVSARDRCIHELFEEQAARTPDAAAVVFEEQASPTGELNRAPTSSPTACRRSGWGRRCWSGCAWSGRSEMVVGLLGILKAGGAYVPLDPTYPAERLAFMLVDLQAPAGAAQPQPPVAPSARMPLRPARREPRVALQLDRRHR